MRKPLAAPAIILPRTTFVLAFSSDQHCGGTTALCPPQITLDDGQTYGASTVQRWLWDCHEHFWDRVDQVRRRTKAKHLTEIFGGDLTEGQHHGTTQILSGNTAAQAQAVNECMRAPLALKPSAIIVIRGTEAHVGKSAEAEEKIAEGLRRDHRPIQVDPVSGTASWWHFKGWFGDKFLDVTHHGRTGQREHTRGGAAVLHAHDILAGYTKKGKRPPDLCLRAHYHRFNDSYDACPTRVVTSGCWQMPTSHVHKIAADSWPDIGGLIVTIREGEPLTLDSVEKVGYPITSDEPTWRAVA